MQKIDGIISKYLKDPTFNKLYNKTIQRIFSDAAIQKFIEINHEAIDDAMIENSLSKLNEFKREMDLLRAGQEGQNPGFSPELYINGNYIDVRYVPTQAFLQEEADRKARGRINNQMMSYAVRQASLQDVHMSSPQRQRLMVQITEFIEKYQENPRLAQAYYLHGPFGVGKTFILGALANQMAQVGYVVTMIHLPTFITNLKSSFKDNTTQDIIDNVKNVDILIIDDIGAESLTVWSRDEVLTPIIEYRMNESLATFFTSNFDMKALEHHLGHVKEGNNEPVKAKRLMERIKYLAKEIEVTGPNLRQEGRQ